MLRSLFAVTAGALVLAACGDSGKPAASTPPPFSGTVLGQPFTPVDASALVLSPSTCQINGATVSTSGLLVGFSSFAGLCAFATDHGLCVNKLSSTIVNLIVVRANAAGLTPGPVQPGTYTISATTPSPDAQGNVMVAAAVVSKTDAQCNEVTPTATSGTIRIDSVGSRITGSADVTFPDGGRVAGSFDVAPCGLNVDACTAIAGGNCPPQHTCIQ